MARDNGLEFRVHSDKVPDWYTARRVAETTYGFKVLVEEEAGRILGAHLIGPHVEESINIFALAIRNGLTAEDIKTTMFAYPTAASDIGYMIRSGPWRCGSADVRGKELRPRRHSNNRVGDEGARSKRRGTPSLGVDWKNHRQNAGSPYD